MLAGVETFSASASPLDGKRSLCQIPIYLAAPAFLKCGLAVLKPPLIRANFWKNWEFLGELLPFLVLIAKFTYTA